MRFPHNSTFFCVLVFTSTLVNAQDWQSEPTEPPIDLMATLTDNPLTFELTAGGGRDPVNVATLAIFDSLTYRPCTQAHIANTPDFRFRIAGPQDHGFHYLRFYVHTQNGADATMLIQRPDGGFLCNDDDPRGGTLDPAIVLIEPASGLYDVWIGTFDGSRSNPAVFFVSSVPPAPG